MNVSISIYAVYCACIFHALQQTTVLFIRMFLNIKCVYGIWKRVCYNGIESKWMYDSIFDIGREHSTKSYFICISINLINRL